MPIGTDNEQLRHAWVRAKLAEIPAGMRLIDVGAGTQPYRDACSHLSYVAQDFAGYDGKGDGVGLQTERFLYGQLDYICDITAIPVGGGTFDAVLCTEVLEHVPSPESALREMSRVLKPGGRLIATVPFVSFTHFAPYHYATGFNRYFFEHHLPKLGLESVDVSLSGGFFDLLAQELLRLDDVARRYARVSGLRLIERWARRCLIRSLQRYRERDLGSSELASFNVFVTARKAAEGRPAVGGAA